MLNYYSKERYKVLESDIVFFSYTSISEDKYKQNFTRSKPYIAHLKTIFVSAFNLELMQSFIEINVCDRNREKFYLHNAAMHLPCMKYLKIPIDIYISTSYNITLYGIPKGKEVIIAGNLLKHKDEEN